MHAIDPIFRQRKDAANAVRRKRTLTRVGLGAAAVLVAALGAGYWLTADKWSLIPLEAELVEVETEAVDADVPVFIPATIDLAGDPMTISIGTAGASGVTQIPRPAALVDPGISPRINMLSQEMLSTSESLMTTIPSSPEDFAYFQAQRAAPALPADPLMATPPGDPAADAAFSDPAAGWGETLDEGTEALPAFTRTRIEDTTSVALVIPEADRRLAVEDFVERVLGPRTLAELASAHGIGEEEAGRAAEALKAQFGVDGFGPGHVVAMRAAATPPTATQPQAGARRLVQLSVYRDATYVGTIARAADGSFVPGVDPWVREDLLHYSGAEQQADPARQYRLLDAVYSTAARNGVPTGVIGEAIMFLSRGQDLNAFATYGDSLVLIWSDTGRGDDGSAGRVLYAAIRGAQKSVECFIFRPADAPDFACVSETDQVRSLTVTNGMVTPVNGVMTSTFGPRRHPILNTLRVHKGVDWAAPVGTPVMAAFDGEVAFRGDGEGYGNVVRLSHGDGSETRYAHLSAFARGLQAGSSVKAGEVIGFVGTTGLSTGPHLHFELYRNGEAVNPLESQVIVASRDTGDAAVELLVDRIIHVESGGSATAKNPLSTATGLGQFIESTWIRMINTYRPDLARSLSREEILKLRFEPTISREMVRRLAQEGEAYLRARGHTITAGRLYLCHFLGMEGAHIVLSASDSAELLPVLGQGVMTANPFLNGKRVADLKEWAERKMRGRGVRAAPAAPTVETREVAHASPEFQAYRAAISALLAGATKTAVPG